MTKQGVRIASRIGAARKTDAAANIVAVTPPPDADPGGAWREAIVERYQSVRRFLPKLCSTISFSATTETQGVLDAFQVLPPLITARPTRNAPVGSIDVRWTDPRARLLAGAVWEQARPVILNALGLPELPDQFLAGHAAPLDAAWCHVAETIDPDTIADGRLHTAKIEAIPDAASLTELRSLVEAMMPRVDLADVILDVMAWHPAFVDRFQQITGGGTRLGDLHLSVAAALTAHALKIGLGPVTSPGIPALTRHRVSHVDQNYLRPDTYIAANRPLIEAQADVGLARHLGSRVLGLRAAGERCSGEPILGKPDNTRTTRTRTIAGGHRTPHGQEETVLMLMLFPWEGHLSAHLVAYCREGPSRVPRVRFAGLSMRGDAETGSVRVRQHQRIVCMLIVCKAWRGDLKQGRRQ